ncbi:photosynthetic NDH subunit of lumenal location 1, chloroplastic-like [Apium graveolens]|uniref:photosynthetic NDH subunit of lumenal location 1, chloroplastic-like n=1 Tax=Apium graveolens TaxID=4045 RepID=UPI003D7BCB83
MAVSSLSLTLPSTSLSKRLNVAHSKFTPKPSAININACSSDLASEEERSSKRRPLLLGVGALALSLLPVNFVLAEGTPANYDSFTDLSDGYSYVYPSDWRDFDYRGHDSAFKDRYLQLQNVRVSFIPTDKSDIHDMGPINELVPYLLKKVLATPTQVADIFDMQERTIDGKNYYTFEYTLTSRNFSRAAFATIAVANGRYYTLIVGANERRWRRVRDKLKVVADSFRVLDI